MIIGAGRSGRTSRDHSPVMECVSQPVLGTGWAIVGRHRVLGMTGISGSLFLYALRFICVSYVRKMETGALFDRACLRYLPSGLDRIKSFVVRKGFNPAAGFPTATLLRKEGQLYITKGRVDFSNSSFESVCVIP